MCQECITDMAYQNWKPPPPDSLTMQPLQSQVMTQPLMPVLAPQLNPAHHRKFNPQQLSWDMMAGPIFGPPDASQIGGSRSAAEWKQSR